MCAAGGVNLPAEDLKAIAVKMSEEPEQLMVGALPVEVFRATALLYGVWIYGEL